MSNFIELAALVLLEEELRQRPRGVGGQVIPHVTEYHLNLARALHNAGLLVTEDVTFTADEIIQIANETSDTFGNLYRLDFIDRIKHETVHD